MTMQSLIKRWISIRTVVSIMIPVIFSTLPGCAAINLKPDRGAIITTSPDYIETLHFYFFGLVGKEHLNIQEICFGKKARQIKNTYNLEDLAIGAKTLFFYMPKSVSIWCEE